MNTTESGIELFSDFIDKDVTISLRKQIYSCSTTMKGYPYIKGKLLKVKSKFILIEYKNKPMVLNIDNILSIE